MTTLPRTEQVVARSLAETADPRDALARALRVIGESLGWRLGAVWEPADDRSKGSAAWRRGAPTASPRPTSTPSAGPSCSRRARASRGGCGAPASRPGSRTCSPTNFPRRTRRGARACTRRCFPIRSARGVLGVIEFFTASGRARCRAARHHRRARRSDRPGGGTPTRRGDAARERGAASRDARRRARLRGHDRPPGPDRRLQPRRRADLRLLRGRRDRPRHGRPDRPTRAASSTVAGWRATWSPARRSSCTGGWRSRACAPTARPFPSS